MRPVNLIPAEDRRGDHAPLRAGAASYLIVGVLALALVGVVMVVLTDNKISDSKSKLASLQARQAQADELAANLAPYDEFATLASNRKLTVTSLAQSRFDWQRVLNELALVIPRKVSLQNLTGTVSASAGTGSSAATPTSGVADASIAGPSLQIEGCARGQTGVARFLAALKDIDGVTRVGMQSSAVGDKTSATSGSGDSSSQGCQPGPDVAQFQITVAFDAVPAAPLAAPPATATPAAATTTTTTPETASADASAAAQDSGVAATQSEQAGAVDSANHQIQKAKDGAAAVGVNGG